MTSYLYSMTARVIHDLYNEGNSDKATLSALRSCSSLLSPKATVIWPTLLANLREKDLSDDGSLTYVEKASFASLHAYAIYKQGTDKLVFANKENKGQSICRALASLRSNDDIRTALDRRMQLLLMSTNFESLTHNLFQLIKILKAQSSVILLDFSQLAEDLFYFQVSNQVARKICLKWGQEYYQAAANSKKE